MSSSELLRSATTTESSIPVPKKPLAGTKRSKGCARLPELQRYIETIIKGSSECESEDAALPEGGTGFPREKKFGRYSVCKGRERAKRDSGGRKSKNNAKTPFTEAVSTAVGEVASFSVSDFDDPRNWRTDGTRNGGLDPEIGNYLEKLFPNPYHLPLDSAPEITEKDALGGPVPVSNVHSVHTQTEPQSESTDDAFFIADIPIKLCTRESVITLSIGPASSEENCERPVSRRGGVRGSNVSVCSKSSRMVAPPSPTVGNRSSHSTVNSRPSSVESVASRSFTYSPKAKRSRLKSTLASHKSREKEEHTSDSDIGKLKLLSMTDSDDSDLKGTSRREKNVERTGSRKFDELYECGDLGNLREIFDAMNNSEESFVELTIKAEPTGLSDNSDNEKLMELLKELTEKSIEDDRQLLQCDSENYSVLQEVSDGNVDTAEEGTKTRRTSFTNFFQEEEMYESGKGTQKKSPNEDSTEQLEEDNKPRSATEDEENNENVDEVLQYMYDCLKKFSNSENRKSEIFLLDENNEFTEPQEEQQETNPEQPTKRGDSVSLTDDSADSFFVKRCRPVKEIQSDSCTFLDDAKRKSTTRTRSRKRDKSSPLSTTELPPNGRPSTSARTQEYAAAKGLEPHPTADSLRITRDDLVQMVETQNELGSYSEQVAGDSYNLKPGHPQSAKQKKGKADSQKVIKEVLEAEERLLANYLNPKPEKKAMEKLGDAKPRKPGNHMVVRSGRSSGTYPFITNFKRSNSNFVICVSSLPRNLRTMAANRTSLALSPSISLSLGDISKNWQIKPLAYYPKASLRKIPVISDIGLSAIQFEYKVQQGSLLICDKSSVAYIAWPFCLKTTIYCSKPQEEFSVQSSLCWLTVLVPPIENFRLPDSSIAFDVGDRVKKQKPETESGRRVDSLLEALERTEGRLMLLEQNELVNSETASSSGNDTYKCDTSEADWEGENSQEKVHDLLMRTISLQHKLQRYLHRKAHGQSVPVCPLMHHEQCWRLSLIMKENYSNTQDSEQCEKLKKVHEVVTTGVQTSEHAMAWKQTETIDETGNEHQENQDESEGNQNEDDDDNSSVCSFKSSNDFSESTEPKPPQKGEFLQKIFNEIESFKQNFKQTKKVSSSEESNNENSESPKENKIAKYNPKMPAKMLRTVFKGRKSLTELTIGLKDVPMTNVSNISVEKRKFSPNHTKISICILKEKPEQSNSPQEPVLRTNGHTLRNKFSTLYLDNMRPSLSRCHTACTKVEEEDSKMSETINESSEDDDDDYQSVASSPSSPDVTKETKNEGKPTAPAPQKTFTKYRFDFYRKMDMSLDAARTKTKPPSTTMCHYKELEPLKKALTEMQIRMRSIKQDNLYVGSDYYERALKLAKMSAGYCQTCGNRTVIPKDTFGYYKSLLPRRHSTQRHGRNFRVAASNPSYYSFRSSNSDSFCDLDIRQSSSYLLNRPNAPFLRSSSHDLPVLIGRI